jgi:hypothetical protein
VTPYGGGSEGFVQNWRRHREWVDDRFYFGFGYGADTNGFGAQGPPRGEDAENPVTYPFTGFGGAVVDRQVSGERTYDINADGVSHYGLYPDWIEDLRRLAGDEIVADMERGPEAYLQMWERAAGIAPDACRDDVDDIAAARAKAVRKGMSAEETLLVLGQPSSRTGDTFTYCVEGGTTTVTFDDAGRATGMKHTKAPKAPKAREAGTAGATGRGSAAGDPPAAQPAAAVAAGHDHRAHVHGPLDLAAAAGREDQGALRILAALLFLTLSVTAVVRRRSR